MSNYDRVLAFLLTAVVLWVIAAITSVGVSSYKAQILRHDCVIALKDKSATDILAVCK